MRKGPCARGADHSSDPQYSALALHGEPLSMSLRDQGAGCDVGRPRWGRLILGNRYVGACKARKKRRRPRFAPDGGKVVKVGKAPPAARDQRGCIKCKEESISCLMRRKS